MCPIPLALCRGCADRICMEKRREIQECLTWFFLANTRFERPAGTTTGYGTRTLPPIDRALTTGVTCLALVLWLLVIPLEFVAHA